jgi:hypothetical protein
MARHAPPPVGERVRDAKAAVPGVTPERGGTTEKRAYIVTGPHTVGGKARGETVELELSDASARVLIDAGHVIPAPKDPRPIGRDKGAGPQDSPADKKGN